MADNRNGGWRGQRGWGESTGARGAFGEQRYDHDDGRYGREPAVDYNDDRSLGGYGRENDRYAGGDRGGRSRGDRDEYVSGLRAGGQSDRYEDYARYADDRGSDYAGARYRGGSRSYAAEAPYPYGSRGGVEAGRDHGAGYYGRSDYGRRGAEPRSFGGGGEFGDPNEYVQAVADGSSHPGEHKGRGPKGYRRSDDRIREDVNDRLTDDGRLDATHIDVNVADGEVTLSGTVSSREAKRRAEDVAERVSGVSDVQNNLKVNRTVSNEINDQTGASTV